MVGTLRRGAIERMSDDWPRLEPILRRLEAEPDRALDDLRALAEEGVSDAILCFALHLSAEEPTSVEAEAWLKRAVLLGHADAAWNLAMTAHWRGEKDRARRWVDEAARLGNADAATLAAQGYDIDAMLDDWRRA